MQAGQFDKMLLKASEAMKRRNYEYAFELYMQVLKMDPDNEEAARAIRELTKRRGQEEGLGKGGRLRGLTSLFKAKFKGIAKKYDEQIVECERYLWNSPFDVKRIMELANAAHAAGYMHRALANYKAVLELDPKNIEALKACGRIYMKLGELQQAARYYDAALRLNPHDGEAARARKDIAAATTVGRIEKMGTSYRDKIADKKQAEKLELEQHILRTEEDVRRAIQLKMEDIKANPKDPRPYREVGDLYLRINDFNSAETYYKKALEVDPTDFFAQEKLAEVQLKRFDYRIRQLMDAYREGPTEEKRKAIEQAKWEKLQFCIEEWTRRVQQHPTDTKLRFELGKFLYQGGQMDEAIAQLQRAQSDPRYKVDAHYLVGMAFRKKGLYDLAVKEFLKAREPLRVMNDKNKEITYELARTYELLGKTDLAREEYQKIIEVDYKFKDVAQRLGAL